MFKFLSKFLATPQPSAPSKATRSRTPGAIDPRVTQANIHETIGKPGYTKKVRPPAAYTDALKRQQMKDWNLPGKPGDYEEDHLIPLELGGHPNSKFNLWPQRWKPVPGAPEKDGWENYYHSKVVSGEMLLKDAQDLMVRTFTI